MTKKFAWIWAVVITIVAVSIGIVMYVTYVPLWPQEAVKTALTDVEQGKNELEETRRRIASMDAAVNERVVVIRDTVKKRVAAMPDDELLDTLRSELRIWRMENSSGGVRD
jgi:hypothetical protein